MFEKDHVVEFPDYTMDGNRTPDLTGIRTRTPLPTDAMSVRSNESRNTVGPSFQLDVAPILEDLVDVDKDEEVTQVKFLDSIFTLQNRNFLFLWKKIIIELYGLTIAAIFYGNLFSTHSLHDFIAISKP